MPLPVTEIGGCRAAGRGGDGSSLADVKHQLATGVHRNRGAAGQREAELITGIGFCAQAVRQLARAGGGAAAGGRQREVDFGLTGFGFKIPEGLKHRGEIGTNAIAHLHQSLVENGGAGIHGDAIEAGIGQAGAGIKVVAELQLGDRHIGHRGRIAACAADQIGRREVVVGQKLMDAIERLAAAQVVEQQGIAVQIAATITAHGGGVGTGGHHAPLPAVEGVGRIADTAGNRADQAPGCGLLVGDAIDHETGVQQPAIRQG